VQKILITVGLILVVAGFVWPWLIKLPFGRLPGDIVIEQPGFKFYFPMTTMIVISIVISVLIWLMGKR